MLDGRPVDDLLEFFDRYCDALPFTGAENGTWREFFFPGESTAGSLAALYRDETQGDGLLAPQQAFLLAFLRMLETPRALMNSLPAMHRQLYYRDFLGLHPRPATPDQVVVEFVPNGTVSELTVSAGTVMDAGQDAQGQSVQYALDSALQVNRGRWTDLRWTLADPAGATDTLSRTVFDEAAGVAWPSDGVRLFDAQGDEARAARGVIIGSAVLAMSGGTRTVTLVFAKAVDPALVKEAFLSGADEWLALTPASTAGVQVTEIVYRLPAEEQAVVAPSALDDLTDVVPLCKVLYTGEGVLPAITSIRVQVDGAAGVAYAGSDGVENTRSRSNPWGMEPVVGSTFALASADWYGKQEITLTVTVRPDWIGLPPNGFPDWYTKYPGAPENNDAFKVRTWIVQSGERTEAGSAAQPLFATGTAAPAAKAIVIEDVRGFPGSADESGDPLNWPGYLAVELTPKDFLHREFQQQQATTSGLNAPYTPQVGSLWIAWSASAPPSRYYHLTPFGHTPAQPADEGTTHVLYLGFSDLAAGQNLSLYWRLRATQPMPLSWQYLNRHDDWISIDALVSDGTQGLFDSGRWSVVLPEDANDNASQMPRGRYWIRAVAAARGDAAVDASLSCPWLVGILPNAATATLANASAIDPSHFEVPLPADTITRTVEPLAGLAEVKQPWPSTGGRLAETDSEFNQRIADRLLTRNRALTWNDMSLMLRDRFPEIFAVYTPTTAQMSELPRPLQQIVVVVPANDARDNDDRVRPAFAPARLASMQSWLQTHASLWADIVVRNPHYRNVEMRCDIAFAGGVSAEYGYRKLKDDLSKHYMPWSEDGGDGAVVGNALDYYGMVSWIQQRPYVGQVINLTLDGAQASVQGADNEVLILHWADDTTMRAKGTGDD
jgi:hypothetical protein